MLAKCPSPQSAKQDVLTAFQLHDRAGKGTISAGEQSGPVAVFPRSLVPPAAAMPSVLRYWWCTLCRSQRSCTRAMPWVLAC